MRAAVLTADRTVEVHEVPSPQVGDDEILIQVEANGICGSDLSAWAGKHPFRTPPVVLGHEPAGTVVALGPAVTSVQLGDRVAIEPQGFCGTCPACLAGDSQICRNKRYPATHDWTGALAEFFAAPAVTAHPVPDGVPLDVAALAEPLAVASHANRRAGTTSGQRVNVIGAGTIGLLSLQVARHLGAEVDVVTDIDPRRLAIAGELGAQRPADVRTSTIVQDLRRARHERADVTIVAATAPDSLRDAAALTRPGGTILLLGLYADTASIAASALVTDEQTIVGSVTYSAVDFRSALRLLADDLPTYERFVTSRIGLDGVHEEFHRQADGGVGLKTLVLPGMTS